MVLGILLVAFVSRPSTTFAAASDDEVYPSFPIANGHFYSQAAGGDPHVGYTITNDGGVGMWESFVRLGGIAALGFPASQRFIWQGFVAQATQRAVLQWNPAAGAAQPVNVLDVLEQQGQDPWLQSRFQIPPVFDNAADAGASWDQIVARHQAELNWNAAIKSAYFSDD